MLTGILFVFVKANSGKSGLFYCLRKRGRGSWPRKAESRCSGRYCIHADWMGKLDPGIRICSLMEDVDVVFTLLFGNGY